MSLQPDSAAAPEVHETGTGSSMAAGVGGAARPPQRKLSVGDLHIRSRHDDSASACREIRAILREIRDSLLVEQQPQNAAADATSCSSKNAAAVGSHDPHSCAAAERSAAAAAAAGEATSACGRDRQGVKESPAAAAHSEVRMRQRRGGGAWRHCRLSLPARLRPGHVDGELNGEAGGAARAAAAAGARRRVAPAANVRFADELGLNLNTFAMIPPRQVRDDSPTLARLSPAQNGGAGRRGSPPPPPPRPRDDELAPDEPTSESPPPDGVAADRENPSPTDSVHAGHHQNHHEQFRLCFRQPFAELDEFRRRLDRQRVCLENVRVDDWSAGPPHHGAANHHAAPHPGAATSTPSASAARQPSSMAANSVILCSIQTRGTVAAGGGGGGEASVAAAARVFARCTSDNWRTFADLPAQRVTGLDSLGLGYERHCFAVRRPAAAPADSRSGSPSPAARADSEAAAAASDGPSSSSSQPSAAVEFAVCYEAAGATFWDNNYGTNYRIEWFQNAT